MNILDSYNQLHSSVLQSSSERKINSASKSQTPEKTDKKKPACSIAAAIGITALCVAGIYLGKIKPKNTVEQITDITQDGIGKLLKENDKLTGKFSKTLEDGSKVVIEYSDGVLQKSTKTAADGTQIFEKVYSRTADGDLLVNNKNITEISNQAKKHQEDFIGLIKKQDSSLDELQSFDRKNLSKKQIDELDGKIKAKKEAVELETQKAKELAEKQAREAKETAEKEAKKAQETAQKNAIEKASRMPLTTDKRADIFNICREANDSCTSAVEKGFGRLYYVEGSVEENQEVLDRFLEARRKCQSCLDDLESLSESDKKFFDTEIKDLTRKVKLLDEWYIPEKRTLLSKSQKYHTSIKKLKNEFGGNADAIRDKYHNVSSGLETMEDSDYDALKSLYAELTETSFSKAGSGEILYHHGMHGSNHELRRQAERQGIHCKYANAFAELKPTEEDVTVFRGMGDAFGKNTAKKIMEEAKVGDIITPDTGSSYAAFHRRELADGFSNGIMEEIRIPKGSKVSINGEHGGEALMPPEAKYRVISKGKDQNGLFNIVLKYIPEEPERYVERDKFIQWARNNPQEVDEEYMLLDKEDIESFIKKMLEKLQRKGYKMR